MSLVVLMFALLTVVFRSGVNVGLYVSNKVKTLLLVLAKIVSRGSTLGSVSLGAVFLFNKALSLTSTLRRATTKRVVTGGMVKTLNTGPSPCVLAFIMFLLYYVVAGFVSGATAATLVIPVYLSVTRKVKTSPETILVTYMVNNSYTCTAPVKVPTGAVIIKTNKCGFVSCMGTKFPLVVVTAIMDVVVLPVTFPFFPWR